MKHNVDSNERESHGTLKSYIIGFILSVALTLAAYFLVAEHLITGSTLLFAVVSLAVIQVIVQFFFFLHFGSRNTPIWDLAVFVSMIVVMAILVLGSLWVMYSLDYRMM